MLREACPAHDLLLALMLAAHLQEGKFALSPLVIRGHVAALFHLFVLIGKLFLLNNVVEAVGSRVGDG